MTRNSNAVNTVRIGLVSKDLNPLALGGSVFGPGAWEAGARAQLWEAMETALALGINHFDTASGYGGGQSEELIGEFLQGRRDRVFLATKAAVDRYERGPMLDQVHASLKRLRTDVIDLYYIHWPRRGQDMRPAMEDLELAREQGKVRAVGVSNFSVPDMEQTAQAGRIDAHQLGYNLIWRFPERDVIPYCVAHNIAVVTYSSIAQGVLTGKFPRQPQFGAAGAPTQLLRYRPIPPCREVVEDHLVPLLAHGPKAIDKERGVASVRRRVEGPGPLQHAVDRHLQPVVGADGADAVGGVDRLRQTAGR